MQLARTNRFDTNLTPTRFLSTGLAMGEILRTSPVTISQKFAAPLLKICANACMFSFGDIGLYMYTSYKPLKKEK